jgi:MFS transporter, UMF1 family
MENKSSVENSRKTILGWCLYDWANSAFATTVMAGFFPILFKEYWSAGVDINFSTLMLGLANSLAGLLVQFRRRYWGPSRTEDRRKRNFWSSSLIWAC